MKLILGKKSLTALILVFVTIVASGYFEYYTVNQLLIYDQLVKHSLQVIEKLGETRSNAIDLAATTRGYVLTGNEKYLEPYHEAVSNINPVIDELKILTKDNSLQQSDIVRLEALIKERISFSDDVIQRYNMGGLTSAISLIETGKGKAILDEIRNLINEMKQRENKLLEERIKLNQAAVADIISSIIIGIFAISIIVLILIIMQNNEAKKKLQAEIELMQAKNHLDAELQANIKKDEFSAMVTHELKTPLVTISGYAEMLQDLKSLGTLNTDQLDAVKEIHANSKKLERLISDIFDAQKTDLKKMKFNIRNFMVDEFMNEIINIHMPLMTSKKIHFVNSTKEKMSIKSDDDRISQVFANLIKNSVDFVPENGRIEINAQSKDNEIVFYVKDNGIGIPKEKQEHLFKKFYQIDTSLQRKHGGTGLGLVICKGIVEGLGGKIWFESDEGKGATFYFSMPK